MAVTTELAFRGVLEQAKVTGVIIAGKGDYGFRMNIKVRDFLDYDWSPRKERLVPTEGFDIEPGEEVEVYVHRRGFAETFTVARLSR